MPLANTRMLIDGRALLDPKSGGVFEYASRLTAELSRQSPDRYAVWANAWRRQPSAFSLQPSAVRVTHWPNKLLHAGILSFKAPKIDRLAGLRPSAFWAPNPHFIALSPGIPLVLTVHDLSLEKYPEFFSSKQRLWHRAVDPARLCRRSAVILAVSERTKDDLVRLYGVPPEKIAVTEEGCDERFFNPPDSAGLEAVKKRFALPDRFILHVGALEPRKNHRSLIDAFNLLKSGPRFADLGMVFAGPPGWKNHEILAAVGRSPYRRDIRLLGFVDREAQRALYRLAGVFAFPSFDEGFGLPPLEAMASGAPVVASFAGALGEVVGDAGVLVDPYRPAELADALAAVLDSPSLAARLSERGKIRARTFTWERCARATSAVFDAVLPL